MTCPFAPHPGEPEEGSEGGKGPPRRPAGPERRSKAQRAFQPTLDFQKNPQIMPVTPKEFLLPGAKEGIGDVIGRVLDQGSPGAVPGMAEEAVSDTVRDRVFDIPDLPDVPPVGAPARGARSRGFAGGGFFFDATQRLFGLMKQVGPGVTGGGEPGGGTGQGGGATG